MPIENKKDGKSTITKNRIAIGNQKMSADIRDAVSNDNSGKNINKAVGGFHNISANVTVEADEENILRVVRRNTKTIRDTVLGDLHIGLSGS